MTMKVTDQKVFILHVNSITLPKSTTLVKYIILPRPATQARHAVDDLATKFYSLTLLLEATLNRCEQLLNQVMSTYLFLLH